MPRAWRRLRMRAPNGVMTAAPLTTAPLIAGPLIASPLIASPLIVCVRTAASWRSTYALAMGKRNRLIRPWLAAIMMLVPALLVPAAGRAETPAVPVTIGFRVAPPYVIAPPDR